MRWWNAWDRVLVGLAVVIFGAAVFVWTTSWSTSAQVHAENPCQPPHAQLFMPAQSKSLAIVAVAKDRRHNSQASRYSFVARSKYGGCLAGVNSNQDTKGRLTLRFSVAVGTTQAQLAYVTNALKRTGLFSSVNEYRYSLQQSPAPIGAGAVSL